MDISAFVNTVEHFFSPGSPWGIFARAGLWFVVAILIIASTDADKHEKMEANMKSYLGGFFLFAILCSGLLYLLFGIVPSV